MNIISGPFLRKADVTKMPNWMVCYGDNRSEAGTMAVHRVDVHSLNNFKIWLESCRIWKKKKQPRTNEKLIS